MRYYSLIGSFTEHYPYLFIVSFDEKDVDKFYSTVNKCSMLTIKLAIIGNKDSVPFNWNNTGYSIERLTLEEVVKKTISLIFASPIFESTIKSI